MCRSQYISSIVCCLLFVAVVRPTDDMPSVHSEGANRYLTISYAFQRSHLTPSRQQRNCHSETEVGDDTCTPPLELASSFQADSPVLQSLSFPPKRLGSSEAGMEVKRDSPALQTFHETDRASQTFVESRCLVIEERAHRARRQISSKRLDVQNISVSQNDDSELVMSTEFPKTCSQAHSRSVSLEVGDEQKSLLGQAICERKQGLGC
ncbi:unnamed protein product, partial [Protopolystoma xenopodis]